MEFKEPIVVTWSDILLSYEENEERDYDSTRVSAIRGAISRELKYGNPDIGFTTRFGINEKGERRFYVRRLTTKEITQQQQSAVGAG